MAIITIRNLESSHVSWLELFFDLSYIAAIGLITHHLVAHISLKGLLETAFLLLLVWWSWVGHTLFANRYGMISHRRYISILTFAQMLGILVLTLLLPGALNEYSAAFGITYGVIRALITLMYTDVYVSFPKMRSMSRIYVAGFSIGSALWIISSFLPVAFRFVMWAIAWLFDFFTPFLITEREHVSTLDVEHLPERVGLFTIIVLGEIFLGLINAALNLSKIDIPSILFIAIGFVLTASIWWIYFDYLETYIAGKVAVPWRFVIYSHFFIYIGLICLSAGVELAIADGHISNQFYTKILMLFGIMGVIIPLSIFKLMTFKTKSWFKRYRHIKPTLIALSIIIVLTIISPTFNTSIFFILVTLVFLTLIYREDKECQEKRSV